MKSNKVFHLSDSDCDDLRAKLEFSAAVALAQMQFPVHAAYEDCIKMLHETRMESFQNRADKRQAKRRERRVNYVYRK